MKHINARSTPGTALWMFVGVALWLAGCVHYPRTAHCPQLTSGSCSAAHGYRASTLASWSPEPDSTMVIVSFSGGGTRAAAFAYGALRGLDHVRLSTLPNAPTLLDRVSLISAVSGGSFTAAHFGLFGKSGFHEFERNFLFHDSLDLFILGRYLLFPPHPVQWWSPNYSRIDYFAEWWDRLLFHKATFQSLEKQKRPLIIINATEVGPLMAPMPFVQERFSALCRDLSYFPIARAVAASSAFPVMLSPLTIES